MYVVQWPTFHGQWFYLISWLFDGLMLYWRYWFSVTQTLNWNYICRSLIYISWSSNFALYFEDYLMDRCHNWNIGSMLCKYLPDKMYLGVWPSFHGTAILSFILKTIWWINVVLVIFIQCDTNIELILFVGQWPIFRGPVILLYILICWWIGILDPCDAKINHVKCMWVSDLHFVVQWFWLIFWRHFDGGMLDWRYWFSVTLSLTYKYICTCRSVTYILWYSDSALYVQYYFMNKPYSLDIGSDMGHWLVFHDSNFESFTYFCL